MVDVEPIWTSLFAKALEGKDVKDLLLNVTSGAGGAAPAAGGAAPAAGGADAPAAEEKAESGMSRILGIGCWGMATNQLRREGGVRRGYGIRSFRLNARNDLIQNQKNEFHGWHHLGLSGIDVGVLVLFQRIECKYRRAPPASPNHCDGNCETNNILP